MSLCVDSSYLIKGFGSRGRDCVYDGNAPHPASPWWLDPGHGLDISACKAAGDILLRRWIIAAVSTPGCWSTCSGKSVPAGSEALADMV